MLHVLRGTSLATYFMHPTSKLRLGGRALVALEAGTVVRGRRRDEFNRG
jgi:hypothetical protein